MSLTSSQFSLEQINVPPKLPNILKQYCKSAIRTQPYDLLKWSHAYFRALANGEDPPVKLKLEYPPKSSAHGLTIGYIKVLFRQLGSDYNRVVPLDVVLTKWDDLCLDRNDADVITLIGKFKQKCPLKKFLSIAVGLITRSITETMILVCELFTHEPEGGSAMIPLGLFMDIYGYLAGLRCDGSEKEPSEVYIRSQSTASLGESSTTRRSSIHNEEKLEIVEVKSEEPRQVDRYDTHLSSASEDISIEKFVEKSEEAKVVEQVEKVEEKTIVKSEQDSSREDTVIEKTHLNTESNDIVEESDAKAAKTEELEKMVKSEPAEESLAIKSEEIDDSNKVEIMDGKKTTASRSSSAKSSARDSIVKDEKLERASLASQNTELDVDLDLDSLIKDESKSNVMSLDSFQVEGESAGVESSRTSASLKSARSVTSNKDLTANALGTPNVVNKEQEEVKRQESKKEVRSPENRLESAKKQDSLVSQHSSSSSSELDSPRCYPVIPGIGRKLLAQEVAGVAIWLAECARRQGGMVGPRNIRHINCPPLDGICYIKNTSNAADDCCKSNEK